jgi:thiol-disulfide isomerase/thioredoxin
MNLQVIQAMKHTWLLRIGLMTLLMGFSVAGFAQAAAAQPQEEPKTPAAALQRAREPFEKMPDTSGLPKAAANKLLEESLERAEAERLRLAQRYAQLFKPDDWRGAELLALCRLFALAERQADAERGYATYLKDAQAPALGQARRGLLRTRLDQQKYREAANVAHELLAEPEYDDDIITTVSTLIGKLAPLDEPTAAAISGKLLPCLFRWADMKVKKGGPFGETSAKAWLVRALGMGRFYRQRGEVAKSDEYFANLMARFETSELSAHKKIRFSLEQALANAKLIGIAAPELHATVTIDLPKRSLMAYRGPVVVLDFLAHWCGPCIAKFPFLNQLQEQYSPQRLAVIGVTSLYGYYGSQENLSPTQELAALKQFREQYGLKFGLLVSPPVEGEPAGEASRPYYVAALPTTVVIDRAGIVRYVERGEGNKAEVERIVWKLLAEPVPGQGMVFRLN